MPLARCWWFSDLRRPDGRLATCRPAFPRVLRTGDHETYVSSAAAIRHALLPARGQRTEAREETREEVQVVRDGLG